MITSEPKGSVLSLFDATNVHFSSESLSFLKGVVQRSEPYMIASSVIGISGMLVIAMKSVSKFAKRKYHLAKTREEAMDWLVEL